MSNVRLEQAVLVIEGWTVTGCVKTGPGQPSLQTRCCMVKEIGQCTWKACRVLEEQHQEPWRDAVESQGQALPSAVCDAV